MILCSIDPASDWKRTGVAMFHNGVLASCAVGKPPGIKPDVLVIEKPRSYPYDHETNPNDLIDVAVTVGRCIEIVQASSLIVVYPADWKGQVPKGIHNVRVLGTLTSAERPRVSGNHNEIDAVGLGLWHLKRLRR